MVVTSIWPIKGRVDRVINYARNPEKTTESVYDELAALHTIDNVVEYATDEIKTERRSYVSCLNCREDTAAAQFVETKRLWDKLGGRACYHGYQSFKADEVRAEISCQSTELRRLRKEVNLCDSIAQRSERVQENLNCLSEQKNLERKELTRDELFRRRGGTGCEAVSGGR